MPVTPKPVKVKETGEVYRGVRRCADEIHGDFGTIYACLRGERKTHQGFTYEYVEDEEK